MYVVSSPPPHTHTVLFRMLNMGRPGDSIMGLDVFFVECVWLGLWQSKVYLSFVLPFLYVSPILTCHQ